MNNQQTRTDNSDDASQATEKYLSLVLDIDSAIAQGEPSEFTPEAIDGLSGEDRDKLQDARRCLELLYDSALFKRLQARAKAPEKIPDELNAPQADETIASHETPLGRFKVVRAIGRGGHGIVFLARDPTLNRFVALKVPHPEILLTPAMRRRFLAEGKASALLTHPNIVTVYEAGEIGPVCYLAQEYVTGCTLAEWLHRETNLPAPRTAAAIVAQLADGIDHAHKRGILHRDLKPGNVLVQVASPAEKSSGIEAARDGLSFVPKIMDFGVAKTLESEGDETATGTVLGTAAYMSPEQANGRHRCVGPTSDVYGLGAILYEMLTGKAVFQGESRIDTLRLVTTAEPTRPRKLRRDIPRDLESICLKCLEKDPARRYASAFELAADLRRSLAGEATVARPISSTERAVRWCRRRPAVASLIAVSILATAALLGVVLWSNNELAQHVIEAKQQWQRAELSGVQSRLRERDARARAYAADMRLVGESWHDADAETIDALLQPYVPLAGRPDLRGFEWWLYYGLLKQRSPSKELGADQARHSPGTDNSTNAVAAEGAIETDFRKGSLSANGIIRNEVFATEIRATAISPDGRLIAVSTADGRLTLLDFDSGKSVRQMESAGIGPTLLAISPDASVVAAVANGEPLKLYGQADRPQEISMPANSKCSVIRYSPGGQYLIVADQSDVIVVGTQLQKIAHRLVHKGTVRGAEFIADDHLLALSSSGDIYRWVLQDVPKPQKVSLDSGELYELAVSTESQCVAVRSAHRAQILDLPTLESTSSLPVRGDTSGLLFLGNGQTLLTVHSPFGCRLWQTMTGQQMGDLHAMNPANVAASFDGYRLISHRGNTLTTIDARPSEQLRR